MPKRQNKKIGEVYEKDKNHKADALDEPASEVAPTEEAKTDEISETKSEDAAPAETTDENQ